jgi:hypothetical protein
MTNSGRFRTRDSLLRLLSVMLSTKTTRDWLYPSTTLSCADHRNLLLAFFLPSFFQQQTPNNERDAIISLDLFLTLGPIGYVRGY